ncbi:benzoate/H(+) symporter BenE family transporter [Uruburuella testudinis]|uniref:Benzoate/H(+) symporter BenE family transporter n=1 Tax=Uruburuella testudinis TaxID=1282863 RepID=A0ABY4DPX1_9NEIS|nr:benzoate/H(+) symporter BenE family transporter [Uruburuella testudinis]UOO80921.1 benzoate/H(+) symporter BenE family transporter [Uruburuella testudinis]
MLKDLSLSAVTAGFLAVLISYAGPMVLMFQAASAAQVSTEMMITWVWAISVGAAVSGILLSWWLKAPVVTAWSAPGSALLIPLFPALSLGEMAGAYLTAAAIMLAIGLSGYFDKLMASIPKGVAAGMMAGILFQFGTHAFHAAGDVPLLLFAMLLTYLISKKWLPRYTVVLVFAVGLLLSKLTGNLDFSGVQFAITRPVWITPEWTFSATLSLALPLVMVSLTGQFLPGMAVLRLAGYRTQARPVMAVTGAASLLTACFGGISIALAAITASLCTGKDAHADPGKRYIAGISNGVFYLIGGLFAGAIVTLFAVLPQALVAILAGLALLGAIGSNIAAAIEDTQHREAAVITFLATASGMTLWGLGSAFWGVIIGMLSAWLLKPKTP